MDIRHGLSSAGRLEDQSINPVTDGYQENFETVKCDIFKTREIIEQLWVRLERIAEELNKLTEMGVLVAINCNSEEPVSGVSSGFYLNLLPPDSSIYSQGAKVKPSDCSRCSSQLSQGESAVGTIESGVQVGESSLQLTPQYEKISSQSHKQKIIISDYQGDTEAQSVSPEHQGLGQTNSEDCFDIEIKEEDLFSDIEPVKEIEDGCIDFDPSCFLDEDGKEGSCEEGLTKENLSTKNRLECGFCGKILSSGYRLKCHVRKHTGEKAAGCQLCGKEFYDPGVFRSHLKKCDKMARIQRRTKSHRINSQPGSGSVSPAGKLEGGDSKEESNAIDKDDKVTNSELTKLNLPSVYDDLNEDSNEDDNKIINEELVGNSKTTKSEFTCSFCGKTLASALRLKCHARKHTGKSFVSCEFCGKEYFDPGSMRRHYEYCKSLPSDRSFPCNICERRFPTPKNLRIHLKMHKQESLAEDGNSINENKKTMEQCPVCGKTVKDKHSFKIHLKLHSGDNLFKCDICSKTFIEEANLEIHRKRIHTEERPFKCSECGSTFVTASCLKVHAKSHNQKFSCDVCGKQFTRRHYFNNHMRTHTEPDNPFKCSICHKEFSGPGAVQAHKLTHMEKSHLCTICGKSFKRSDHLHDHLTTHNVSRPFVCDCGRGFNKACYLIKHQRISHGKSGATAANKVSAGTLPGKPGFKCNSKVDVQCDTCGKKYLSKQGLMVHMMWHAGVKPYQCTECGKSFRQVSVLKTHSLIHTGEKPFKCDVCGKGFPRPSILNQHMRTHTDEKPFKCDVCSKEFRLSSTLAHHKRIHTGEKPYKCTVCDKSFAHLFNYSRHMNVHAGLKPFKCDICEKQFSATNNLKQHILTHTGERPFKCSICGQSYTENRSLKKHMQIHYEKNSPDTKIPGEQT